MEVLVITGQTSSLRVYLSGTGNDMSTVLLILSVVTYLFELLDVFQPECE